MTVRHKTKFLQSSLSHKNQKLLFCPGKQEHLFSEINPALLARPQGEGDVIPTDLSAASRVTLLQSLCTQDLGTVGRGEERKL